jgi:hypothetical protein
MRIGDDADEKRNSPWIRYTLSDEAQPITILSNPEPSKLETTTEVGTQGSEISTSCEDSWAANEFSAPK